MTWNGFAIALAVPKPLSSKGSRPAFEGLMTVMKYPFTDHDSHELNGLRELWPTLIILYPSA